MNIYSKNSQPYVYKCIEKDTGRFYIGYRYANKVPATEDFGVHYFTSNDYVKKNFDKFNHEIIAEFSDRKSAFAYETKLINETKSKLQINANKHNKSKKPYGKAQINENCLLCGKYINSSIKKFCCRSHAGKYNASNKQNIIPTQTKLIIQETPKKIKEPKIQKQKVAKKIKEPKIAKKDKQMIVQPSNYTITRISGTLDSVMWSLKLSNP
jgi:hypothetical protein